MYVCICAEIEIKLDRTYSGWCFDCCIDPNAGHPMSPPKHEHFGGRGGKGFLVLMGKS